MSSKVKASKSKPNKVANNTNAAQNSVNERRLRPIYDWLDNGNNKKALQEADKLLKKQPDLSCCKVLKSLALIRLGREEEAQPLIDSVLENVPMDDSALQAMSIAYRELQQPEKICLLYEKAVKLDPTNEEWLSHLFVAYVRVSNYKKQQQVAMTLYKVRPKTPYYFWAVMSIVLQATVPEDENLAQTITLPLAERMLSVMAKDKKLKQEQDTRLFLLVLEMQNKFSDALAILNGPMGKQLETDSSQIDLVVFKKVEYLKKLDMWDQVYDTCLQLLQTSEDQWNLYLDFITAVFRLVHEGKSADVTIQTALDFVISQQKKFPKARGPFLAEIEILSRLLGKNENSNTESEMVRLLVSYFEKFGSKPVCPLDLKLYLSLVKSESVSQFFDATLNLIQFGEAKIPADVPNLHKHVCWHQLRRFCGVHHSLSTEEQSSMVDELCLLYRDTFQLVQDCSPTEIRVNDAYIVLAGHLLWQQWTKTGQDHFFWKGVVILQAALKKSPWNYHFRFILIKFFNQIGAVGVSHNIYGGLELKHIQLDSLGHVMTPHLMTSGHFSTQSTLFGNALKFFTGNYKDIIDYIISAYRCGSFDKILEFIRLRDRLSASQHYTAITVERMILDLVSQACSHSQSVQMMSYLEIDPEKDEINWSGLRDNRDFTAMQSWDPPQRAVTKDLISESFADEQKFLKFRGLIIRCLASAVYMSEDIHPARVLSKSEIASNHLQNGDSNKDKAKRMSSVIENLVNQISDHSTEVRRHVKVEDCNKFLNPVQGPSRSRLVSYVLEGQPEFMVEILRLVLEAEVACSQSEDRISNQEKFITRCSKIVEMFDEMISKLQLKMNSHVTLLHRQAVLESVVNLLESGSFVCIICGVCRSLFHRVTSVGGGKKNKKKVDPTDKSQVMFTDAFNKTISSVQSALKNFSHLCSDLEKKLVLEELEKRFSDIHLCSGLNSIVPDGDEILAELRELTDASYSLSFVQIKNILNNKVDYLGHLNL